jgi:exonuclease III
MKRQGAEIIYLQETDSVQSDQTMWQSEWGGPLYISSGISSVRRCAILIKKGVNTDLSKTIIDENGRFLCLKGIFDTKHLTLLNYYGPTKDNTSAQIDCLNIVKPIILQNIDELLWGGDINLNLDPKHDKKGGKVENVSEYPKQVSNLMEENNLIDIWRVMNPDETRYTWHQNTVKGIVQSRLDYWFTPVNMLYDLHNTEILNSIYSDQYQFVLN